MPLFQSTVVQKYLKAQDETLINEKWEAFKAHFHNPTIQENVRNAKEEQYQEGFLRDLFVNILGYTLNPETNFNLTTELKNVKDAKKADGGILSPTLSDEKGERHVIGVVELKSTETTDLSKVEAQAFGYKNNQKNCSYVIISNFEKLRFYIDNAIEHESFDLFQLTEAEFKLLYLCLGYENISKDIPKKVKKESLSQEDEITKQLYKDYSLFKRILFNNLTELNPDVDPLLLFKKSQKLLDRFLFLFFAEDRHLLPPNSVRMILKQWKQLKELDAYTPLYDRFKKYFGYLNTGFKGKQYDVYPYNGGLFKADDILDNININDYLLYEHTLKLSEYDFDSEVDVNILGHIFENSLNEIEEIQTKLEENPTEKVSISKRKKDGVFYTPKYITKYIVENTVGKLCEEQKEKLDILEEDYTFKRQKKTKETLLQKLKTHREWLLQLTIVDPACGSGAFLNEALNYLIAEHQYLDELETKLMGGGFVFPNVENSILEHNLFGVDINNESVEIAKLSLWLRTAQPNRKLNDLNHNIKCGNSLIDDPKVAGDKAFNWEKEFPKVFADGGFDVVIGNPPYVFARDNFSKEIKQYYSKNYVSAEYQINLYLLFIERTINIIKDDSKFGLIVPNAWLMVDSAKELRKFILKNCAVNQIINLTGYSFEGVNVETIIVMASKNVNINSLHSIEVLLSEGEEFKFSHNRKQMDFSENKGFEFRVFSNEQSVELTKKLKLNSKILDDLVHIKAGLQAYEKNKGEPKQTAEDVKNRPYDYDYKHDENTHKYLEGRDVGRYSINWSGQYLSYGKQLASPRTFDLFDGEKIIVREITGKFPKNIISTYNDEIYLYNRSNIGILAKQEKKISLKYIVSIINSKVMAYYFMKNTAKSVRKMFPKIILNDLRKFPTKDIPFSKQQPFIEKTNQMLALNENLQEITTRFQRSLQRQFPEELEKLPKKLQSWYELNFADFVKEIKKKKIKLSLTEEAEWEDYFLAEQEKAASLKTQIDQTDNEIDQMVYELYGLTEEEIKIVENS